MLQSVTVTFWGKARPAAGSGTLSHALVWHQLDVAAALEALLELPAFADVAPRSWNRLLIFFAALHDIGKFSRSFQALAPEHWPRALGPCARIAGPRHDTLGWMMLSRRLDTVLATYLPDWSAEQIDPVLRAVAGHHGRPPEEHGRGFPRDAVCTVCLQAAADWIATAAHLLPFNPPPPPTEAEAMRLSWIVAGLVNLADWLGSNQTYFEYRPAEDGDPTAYLAHARECAARAVAASGLQLTPVAPAGGIEALFPSTSFHPMQARPMQRWAETVSLPPGPLLAIIEDTTGSGKTEAALVLAHRLMAAGHAHGLFFALPTMATADAMFARLGASYRRMYQPGSCPSLVLTHAQARLHEGFRASILDGASDTELGEDGAEAAGPACAAWIADDRRKSFLAEIGAGTIDQALLAALPSRYAALRLVGLSRRVLIVDEVHAYDPYMHAELCGLLGFQAALGGSAILLSATLPQAVRSKLADAFAPGRGATLDSTQYPLATLIAHCEAKETREDAVRAADEAARRVAVRRFDTVDTAAAAVLGAAERGAAVAWIRNTVDEAIAAHALIAVHRPDALLFHARFAFCDRTPIEARVSQQFARDSHDRAGIVVATQVIEQSLDLDFDLIVTDLAPIDLLIQRAGRVWRHKRLWRPLNTAELCVLSPAPVDDPPADWLRELRGTESVYRDPALLWRSARMIFTAGAIETPGGLRALIEPVYARDPCVPNGLMEASGRAFAKGIAEGRLGEFKVLSVSDGYCRTLDSWNDDERTPTRLDENSLKIRLARFEDGTLRPWSDNEDESRAWALSELTVSKARFRKPDYDAAVDEAMERVCGRWPKHQRTMPVLVLGADKDGWYMSATARYHRAIGLVFGSTPEDQG
jgi:CRISPR-associated endonuclease/helicase Cas3